VPMVKGFWIPISSVVRMVVWICCMMTTSLSLGVCQSLGGVEDMEMVVKEGE
jgi:hypothetical protein